MARLGRYAPAIIRRAFFILGTLALPAFGAAPIAAPDLAQVGLPDEKEVAQILQQFRQTGIAGDYYVEFELRTLPRRGEEKLFQGKMWGSRTTEGAITRVILSDATGREQRVLLQNGPQPAVWRVADQKVAQVDATAAFEPVVPGVNLTTFDLQMPYLYWPGAILERVTRMRGRPAHVFLFRPPATFATANPKLGSVRAYLDTVYNAPSQTETLDREGHVIKTFTLLNLKHIGEQWIPQSFEVRDDVARDKTRLTVTGAALNLSLPASVFAPAGLTEDVKPPGPDRLQKISP